MSLLDLSDIPYYITTPIYYVNDVPHIGHAYTSIAADVVSRFKRLQNADVFFLTGTDEHGQKIEAAAKKNDVAPADFVAKMRQSFIQMSELCNLSNDDFICTTDEYHIKTAIKVYNQLYDAGYIYEGKYSGWYSVRDESFFEESELIDGKAPTGAEVTFVEEDSYFFALSKFQDKLLTHYEEHPDFIMPKARRNEVISFVKSGLKDLSISRSTFSWGIPLPQNPKHVMYVWIDALTNYISATTINNRAKFWPANVHLVGKDILRFHAVIWPAILMAADLPLPKTVFAHGWWMVDGQKMSKSIGNVISPSYLVERYGVDYTRYFLMKEMPFGNDGNFSHEQLISRINGELANNIGNLFQRTLSLVHKFFNGELPNLQEQCVDIDLALLAKAEQALSCVVYHIDALAIHLYLDEIVSVGRAANEYIDVMAPWSLAKTDLKRTAVVLFALCNVLTSIAVLMLPITPTTASKMLGLLGRDINRFSDLLATSWNGYKIKNLQILFPRLS